MKDNCMTKAAFAFSLQQDSFSKDNNECAEALKPAPAELDNQEDGCLDAEEHYRQLTERLLTVWNGMYNEPNAERTVVVVPSMSLDYTGELGMKGSVFYEERLLSFLTLLGLPRTHVIYVSSVRIPEEVISYYLQFLPGVPYSHAYSRLHLMSVMDNSDIPLTRKILDRPALIKRIRRAVVNPSNSYLEVYCSTPLEKQLSLALDLPVLGADPDKRGAGSKSGGRRFFKELDFPLADGIEDIHDEGELAQAIVELAGRYPDLEQVIVKLNHGFSGVGNAICDLKACREAAPAERIKAVLDYLPSCHVDGTDWEHFVSFLHDKGAVAEAFLQGEGKVSLTVQLYLCPDGRILINSTHEQMTGGPRAISYRGCRLPAPADFRASLHAYGMRVGEKLAAEGVLGPVSVDFVAFPGQVPTGAVLPASADGAWAGLCALELNIRRGGTTYPLYTTRFLTGGVYDVESGEFRLPNGKQCCYVSLENAAPPEAKGLCSRDLIDIAADAGLHYNPATGRGAVFHMISALSQYGRVGATCIASTPEEAEEVAELVRETLREGTRNLAWLRS